MDNMKLYNKFKDVPLEAQKKIEGGRLRGFTDINPMWRIKVLTEVFGPVGIGWYYEIKRSWTEVGAKEEKAVFVEVLLFYKHENEWSKPIPGVGGNTLVESEKNGLRTNDECYKMALTDALSVACKSLGIGADIYYEKDSSKYNRPDTLPPAQQPDSSPLPNGQGYQGNGDEKPLSEKQCMRYYAIAKQAGLDRLDADKFVLKRYRKEDVSKLTKAEYDKLCNGMEQAPADAVKWYREQVG